MQITYDFTAENMAFRIPVQVTLVDDYMQASLLYDEIEEYGASRITSINLMPYFGAGAADEDGYLFIPDGSGALVEFSDNVRNADEWRQTVYGPDPAVNLMLRSVEPPQTVRMPVFGIKKGDGAFLAVISEGDTAASVFAANRFSDAPYAAVGSAFIYHQYDMTGLRAQTGIIRPLPLTQEQPVDVTPKVRYYFLNGEDANYSGMARRYRAYLEDTKGLTLLKEQNSSPVSLSFYGSTTKESRFLGIIPYNKKVTATEFSEVADYLGLLREAGISNPDVFLYGFEKGGYQQAYGRKQSFDSAVGGKKGYTSLLEGAPQVTVYTMASLSRDYGSVFSQSRYIRGLNRMSVLRRNALLSTGDWDFDGVQWRYLRPSVFTDMANEWIQSAVKADNAGVLFGKMGQELYSDITTDAVPGRDRTASAFLGALSTAGESFKWTAAEGCNIYLAADADLLTEVPVVSSNHDIISEDVPFLMMALHGYVRMVSEPVNRMADRAAAIPVLLGAGVQANWQLTAIEPVKLADTSLSFLYNTQMNGWTDDIVETAQMFSTVQQDLANVPIQSHSRAEGLDIFTYENGTRILANGTDSTISYMGTSVPAGQAVLMP